MVTYWGDTNTCSLTSLQLIELIYVEQMGV